MMLDLEFQLSDEEGYEEEYEGGGGGEVGHLQTWVGLKTRHAILMGGAAGVLEVIVAANGHGKEKLASTLGFSSVDDMEDMIHDVIEELAGDPIQGVTRAGPLAVEQEFGLDASTAGLLWESVVDAITAASDVVRHAVSVDHAIHLAAVAVLDAVRLPMELEAESEAARTSAREEGVARVDAIIRACLGSGMGRVVDESRVWDGLAAVVRGVVAVDPSQYALFTQDWVTLAVDATDGGGRVHPLEVWVNPGMADANTGVFGAVADGTGVWALLRGDTAGDSCSTVKTTAYGESMWQQRTGGDERGVASGYVWVDGAPTQLGLLVVGWAEAALHVEKGGVLADVVPNPPGRDDGAPAAAMAAVGPGVVGKEEAAKLLRDPYLALFADHVWQ